MSYEAMLSDTCRILTRGVDSSGKYDVETWTEQAADTACRPLIRIVNSHDAEKARHATLIRARFALPLSATISLRDRVRHEGRVYDVIQINSPRDLSAARTKVAVCEAVAGSV